jgi:6-phosphogluconate dehydrogenase (decarboxylating)
MPVAYTGLNMCLAVKELISLISSHKIVWVFIPHSELILSTCENKPVMSTQSRPGPIA